MAMAADLGRAQQQQQQPQQQPMDLRRALQDGRAVLAGGPGLGPQMILLRNEPLPPLQPQQTPQYHHPQSQQYPHLQPQPQPQQHQHSLQPQANSGGASAVPQEYSYPVQGYVGQQEDPTRHVNAELGAPGTIPQDQVAATNPNMVPPNPNMAPPFQGYASSAVSSGLGFHNMEYVQPVGALPESYVQPYPHAVQSYPVAASNYDGSMHIGATAQQGFVPQGYGIGPATETSLNPPGTAGQELDASGYPVAATAARVNFRASSAEDERRLAMIHEFGNDSHSHIQNQMPHFQPQYHQSIPLDPALGAMPTVEYLTQQIHLQQQRIRQMELQHLWRRQLEVDLQRRREEQLKQREQSLRQRGGNRDSKMRKNKGSSRHFQRSGNRKKSKLPAVAGPEGPGWCDICQTDCNTDEMLQYHFAGKRHKKKLQQLGKEGDGTLENASVDENLKQCPIDGKETGDLLNADTNVFVENSANFNNSGTGMEVKKRDFTCIDDSSVEPLAKRVHVEDQQLLQKSLLTERCEICNIACNTKAVLELHFKGKKHAANLKKVIDGAHSRRMSSYRRGQRNNIRDRTAGKELSSGLIGDSEKGLSSIVAEEQSLVLKDTSMLPDGSTTRESIDNGDIGNSDPFKAT